jgi:hypothetical protein
MKKLLLPLAVLVPFTAYSTLQVVEHGYLAFLDLAQHPWGVQVLLDLVIAVSLFAMWMRRALRERAAAPGFARPAGAAPSM